FVGWVERSVTHRFCIYGDRRGGLRFANPPYDCITWRESLQSSSALPLLLLFRRLRVAAGDELRVEADIEDVAVGGIRRRCRIDEIVGDQRQRHALVLAHLYRRA